ncbi:MAG: hypothetical protein WAW69_03930 [Polaromonas sp.]
MNDAIFLIANLSRYHWKNDLFLANTAQEAWSLRDGLDQRITQFKFTPRAPAYSKPHGLLAQPPKAVKRLIFIAPSALFKRVEGKKAYKSA